MKQFSRKDRVGSIVMLFAFFIGFICIVSCKKNDTVPEINEEGLLFLTLHTNVDTAKVIYGALDTMTGGRKISVSLAQLYFSSIKLVKENGEVVSFPSAKYLKTQEEEIYYVGRVPSAKYKYILLDIGLDSVTNKKEPTTDINDVLNRPAMWFGATAQPEGYIYINFQGTIDTTKAANGLVSDMQPFHYQLGTSLFNKTIGVKGKGKVVVPPYAATYVHISVDYAKLFKGVDLRTPSNLSILTKSDNSLPIAAQISKNLPEVFLYETKTE